MVFVDTNVFVYAYDASWPAKQAQALRWLESLWASRDGRVSYQVLQELYYTITRKLERAVPVDEARAAVGELTTWKPVRVDGGLLKRAWAVQDRFGFSFWDALVVAAAQVARCRYLLTEDLQHGQDLGGLTVISPFEQAPESIGGA